MRVGFGFSREKDFELALAEAYRKSLQKIKATKADLCLIFYSYDYALDPAIMGGALKKILRDIPNFGCSTWSAFNQQESFEAETGVMVVSYKDPNFTLKPLRVHSLREKAELWATELGRQIEDSGPVPPTSVLVMADSLSFSPGSGFQFLERKFPHIQFSGFGISFSVPQCSILCQNEVHLNSLLALAVYGTEPWVISLQNIRPELKEVSINRMSENLIIEIDEKPAFYKLCEHLMVHDDLPMMSPDEFRKHMGNLYIVEQPKVATERPRAMGESYRTISLLGSEMTTGMVAVAQTLDFSQSHWLGQKRSDYAEGLMRTYLEDLQSKLPKPSFLMLIVNTARSRDKERQISDFELLRSTYPDTPIVGITSNGEFFGGPNQLSAIVLAWP